MGIHAPILHHTLFIMKSNHFHVQIMDEEPTGGRDAMKWQMHIYSVAVYSISQPPHKVYNLHSSLQEAMRASLT